jgi:hypothetical protein
LVSRFTALQAGGETVEWRRLKIDAAQMLIDVHTSIAEHEGMLEKLRDQHSVPDADRARSRELLAITQKVVELIRMIESAMANGASIAASCNLVLVNSGQTGVERGAYRGARTAGVPVVGYSMRGARDELSRLPEDLANALEPTEHAGVRIAAMRNLGIANALVIAVPRADEAREFPGIAVLQRAARTRSIPCEVVDAQNEDELGGRLAAALPGPVPPVVYVTGPRETRWSDGAQLGRRVVMRLANALEHA